jgi:hypothetical protein
MEAVRTRRWYRMHWLTWVAVAVESAAITYCQSINQFGGFKSGFFVSVADSNFGWPVVHKQRAESGTMNAGGSFSGIKTVRVSWYLPSLAFNGLCWFVFVVSVGWFVESWLRKPKRWQFSLRGLGLLIAVIGAVLTLFEHQSIVDDAIRRLGMEPGNPFDLFGKSHLIAVYRCTIGIIVWGVGCTIWTLTHGLIHVVIRLVRLFRRVTAAHPLTDEFDDPLIACSPRVPSSAAALRPCVREPLACP